MKYFITVLVTAVVVFFGATVYYRGLPTFPSYNRNPIATESAVNTETLLPSPTPTGSTTVKAGGVLVFNAYSIDIPADWQYKKEGAPTGDIELDKLTLTKGAYKISIYQAATWGAPCLYPGDPDTEGPASRFTSFVGITTSTGDKLRRGTAGVNPTGYTVCELQSGGYGQPTNFGHIAITVPSGGGTAVMLTEIDSILSSLKKI